MKLRAMFWKLFEPCDEILYVDAMERRDGRSWAGYDVSALATLAHNLALAGFGAAMFRAGDNHGFHMGEDSSQCTCQWSPNVDGEPYEGSTRCEFEDDGLDDHSDCECTGADPLGLLDDVDLDPLDHGDLELAERITVTGPPPSPAGELTLCLVKAGKVERSASIEVAEGEPASSAAERLADAINDTEGTR